MEELWVVHGLEPVIDEWGERCKMRQLVDHWFVHGLEPDGGE